MLGLDDAAVRTFVVVPVKNEWALTAGLLACLRGERADDTLVIDNGSTDGTINRLRVMQRSYPGLHWHGMPGRSIYEMWCRGFDRARTLSKGDPFRVLITNNDVLLPPGALDALRRCLAMDEGAIAAYPDYDARGPGEPSWTGVARRTSGVLSDGGLFGACFMLAGERVTWKPLITDLSYEWWYGDNHLAETIAAMGGAQVRAVGLPVHHENEGTARHEPTQDLFARKWRDRHRWLTRYDR